MQCLSVARSLSAKVSLFPSVVWQPAGPFFKGQRDRYAAQKFRYTTIKQLCVTSQKSKIFTDTAAETRNDAKCTQLHQICNFGVTQNFLKGNLSRARSQFFPKEFPPTSVYFLAVRKEQFTLTTPPLKFSVSLPVLNPAKPILSALCQQDSIIRPTPSKINVAVINQWASTPNGSQGCLSLRRISVTFQIAFTVLPPQYFQTHPNTHHRRYQGYTGHSRKK